MANTPNYNLKKVEYTEIADIPGHFNANFDTIDTAMKNNADAAAAAEDNAKSYADDIGTALSGIIGSLGSLLTTVKTNIVAAINSLKSELDAHKAENVTDAGGVHGLQIKEGEWTPKIISSDGGEGVYSSAYGSYVAIGKLVYAQFSVELSNKGTLSTSTGNIMIAGLPFTISGYSGADVGAVTFGSIEHVTYPENAIRIYGTLQRGQNYIKLNIERNGTTAINLIPEHLENTCRFRGAFVYKRVI